MIFRFQPLIFRGEKHVQNLVPCWRGVTVDLATQDMGRGSPTIGGGCVAKKGRMKGWDVQIQNDLLVLTADV